MRRTAIAIFARLPAKGRVKTRIARALGPQRARELHRACLQSTALLVDSLPRGIDRFLYCTGKPERARLAARRLGLPNSLQVREQAGGSLGRRLAKALEALLGEGYERVLFLGSDSPTVSRRSLLRAAGALDYSHAVIGPAEDGGYYLLGARVFRPEMFSGIDWGTDRAFEQTRAGMRKAGLRVTVLSQWYDVDRPDDLLKLKRDVRRQPRLARYSPLRNWLKRQKL